VARKKVYKMERRRISARIENDEYAKILDILERNSIKLQEYLIAVIKDDLAMREREQLRTNSTRFK